VVATGCSSAASRTGSGPAPMLSTTSTSSSTTSTSTTVAASTTTTATTVRVTATTTATTAARTSATPPPTRVAVAAAPACPANLADGLARTGGAQQLITVEAAGWGTSYAEVELWQKEGGCWQPAGGPWSGRIGENGFRNDKTEGDGTTPTGMYGVGPVMYGNSPNPGVHETYVHIVENDWWDEDPTSSNYNRFEYVPPGQPPPGGGSEALWKEQAPYPSFAVIDYNTDPVVPYKGSAIFFHADTGSATAGCVSVPLADLDRALDWMQPALQPAFVMGPAQEISSF
jgi:L,D-peptidoglycan transpeptidase YkuD (ErfK/YbiS/YcfS/YnhG family)